MALSGLSGSTITLATKWIENCSEAKGKHRACGVFDETTSRLPARVLDIGRDETSIIKLHVSEGGETGRYVALSHCWGGKTPVVTATQNLQEHLREIPPSLPPTFKEAVMITRRLGVRYLWIDSLCIVQDSPEDWAIYAPQMAQVYGKAYVTISTDAAENREEGFVHNPKRAQSSSRSVAFTHDGQESVVYVRERGALAYQLPYHDIYMMPSPRTLILEKSFGRYSARSAEQQ